MDDLCTDESDVIFTESPDLGKAKSTSRSRSLDPARCAQQDAPTSQQDRVRSSSASPSRRRTEPTQSTERRPISGVLTMKPTNLDEEMDSFFASAFQATPQFKYAKSDSCIKQAFSENSNVCFDLLPEVERILARVKTEYGSSEEFLERLYGDEKTTPNALREKILEYLKDHNMEERVKVRIVDNGLSAASVSKAYCPKTGKHTYTVNIAKVPFSSNMVQGTCDHEIGTHLLRMRNDEMQVWHGARHKYKLLNPWITEEGFATLNTFQSMPCKLLFPQALRYYAVCRGDKIGFVELFHELQSYVDNPKLNWQMCCRVKRGLFDTSQPGAFNMDQAYFKGAVEILRHLDDIDLVQLYSGQVAMQDLTKVKFLLRREEVVLPWFLNCPEALEVYKEHCHQLIHENQIACATGRKPPFFRVAADLLKKIPRWTKATPAFLHRRAHGSNTSKSLGNTLDNSSSNSTTVKDEVPISGEVHLPVGTEAEHQTLQSEKLQATDAFLDKLQELRCCSKVLRVGEYVVTYGGIRVGPEATLGHTPIAHLSKSTKVNVLELMQVEQRIRARIDNPVGWISLMNTETAFQWATAIESTLSSSYDHSANVQDADQKQEDGRMHETQKQECAVDGSQSTDSPVREEEHGLSRDAAETTHSPQPQDGMHENCRSDFQDEAEKALTLECPSSDRDPVVQDATEAPTVVSHTPEKIEHITAHCGSSVEDRSLDVVPSPAEMVENPMWNNARRNAVEYANVSIVPAIATSPRSRGSSFQNCETVGLELTRGVCALADAVKEWKRLKAEFDSNIPRELAKAVEVDSSSKSRSRRSKIRISRKVGQEMAQCAQSAFGCPAVDEKASDSKLRKRHKRKSRKSAPKDAAEIDLNAII